MNEAIFAWAMVPMALVMLAMWLFKHPEQEKMIACRHPYKRQQHVNGKVICMDCGKVIDHEPASND